ncbi:hypothetical protein ACW2QC_03935 [Virgibacillus sp. FSP13]
MVFNLALILKQVPLKPEQEKVITSEQVKTYIKMAILEQKIQKDKNELSKTLTKKEKQSIDAYFNVPKYLTVREVSNLTGLSQQIIRRHCANGKYKGYQASGQNGTWHVESEQFTNLPNWIEFIAKRAEEFEQTKTAARLAQKLLEESDVD